MMSWLLKIRHILFQLKTSEFDPSPFCIFVNQKFFVIVDEGYDTTADHNSNINVNFHLCPIENASSDVVIDEGQKDSHIYGAHTAFSDNNNIMLRTFVETANNYSASVKTTNTSNDIGQKPNVKVIKLPYANLK